MLLSATGPVEPYRNGAARGAAKLHKVDAATFPLGHVAGSRFPLLEYAPDAAVIVDGNGVIALVNAQTERLFGYEREELVGQHVEILIPQRYHEVHVAEREGYCADPRARPMGSGLELYGRRKDGSEFPVEVSLSPIVTSEGRFVASAIRDATERKAFERRLQELNEELQHANRAKDTFLASVSHELRTPLNAILGFTGTLLMKLPGPLTVEQERQLQIVRSSATHLLSLINDILDLSKIESGKRDLYLEEVALEDVITEVSAALSSSAAEKALDFSISLVNAPPSVSTDRRALAQILLNLTNNAIKYTEKGSVRIEARGAICNGASAVAVSVIDTGIGIQREDLQRLFEPFNQLDPSSTRRYEGTGLGLYLSRSLALLLGGSVSVTSNYGEGSSFTLTLPIRRRS
jgi:PAS domain S-box-containing protein